MSTPEHCFESPEQSDRPQQPDLSIVESEVPAGNLFSLEQIRQPDFTHLTKWAEKPDTSTTDLIMAVLGEAGLVDNFDVLIKAKKTRLTLESKDEPDDAEFLHLAKLDVDLAKFDELATHVQDVAVQYEEKFEPNPQTRIVSDIDRLQDELYDPSDAYSSSALIKNLSLLRSRVNKPVATKVVEAERIARLLILDEVDPTE